MQRPESPAKGGTLHGRCNQQQSARIVIEIHVSLAEPHFALRLENARINYKWRGREDKGKVGYFRIHARG